MNKIKTVKGITLVALIITIVVLLILAMVAIGAVQESNIIGHAQNAAGRYDEEKGNENNIILGYEKILNQYAIGENTSGSNNEGISEKQKEEIISLFTQLYSSESEQEAEEADNKLINLYGIKRNEFIVVIVDEVYYYYCHNTELLIYMDEEKMELNNISSEELKNTLNELYEIACLFEETMPSYTGQPINIRYKEQDITLDYGGNWHYEYKGVVLSGSGGSDKGRFLGM